VETPLGLRLSHGAFLSNIRLRTKFLFTLVAISTCLTAAALMVVSYGVKKRVRENLREDLGISLNTYRSFASQREQDLTHSAAMLANLPNVRALMSTGDPATIDDASTDVWRLSGSDLLVLANRTGTVSSVRTRGSVLDSAAAQGFLHGSLDRSESQNWWYGGGHLYEVYIQPIYFGAASQNLTIGMLVVGHEVNQAAARDFAEIASSEVAFTIDGRPVASTLGGAEQSELAQKIRQRVDNASTDPQEFQLGRERYLARTVNLSHSGGPVVSLTVLKSFDKESLFLNDLNRGLIALGLLSIPLGSALVFWISHTYFKPLAGLVEAARALGQGDYNYPLNSQGGDEVSEVTGAFVHMRSSLETTQKEHKQLEERLRQAHKMEAVGRLAGGVAHDFNNLLTIIRGNSDLLKDREGSDAFHRKCVEQIQKASGRAVSMTRQLLAFSRMQVLQPRALDLNQTVIEMGKMLPRLIGEHIEYSFAPDPRLATVTADPGQIEQVILNLAVNARDAMPRGGKLAVCTANVTINEAEAVLRPPMVPGRFVLLSVNDTGHGMDEATKAHIFEPFFTTKEVGKGTGLGLATVYGIVKQSGGFIWVESVPGKGTTFEIYLPQAAGTATAENSEENSPVTPAGSETVLVVEDEGGVRELACQFLRVKGYRVLEAGGGLEALAVSRSHPGAIHLLLSDVVMPRMSGGELAVQLLATRPDLRVAFMSGYSEFSRGDLGKEFPDAPMLQKPFSPTSLVDIVRQALARPQTPILSERRALHTT